MEERAGNTQMEGTGQAKNWESFFFTMGDTAVQDSEYMQPYMGCVPESFVFPGQTNHIWEAAF